MRDWKIGKLGNWKIARLEDSKIEGLREPIAIEREFGNHYSARNF